MPSHFYNTADYDPDTLSGILRQAHDYKQNGANAPLKGRELMLIFLNPSLRTRVSFETGMRALGGGATTLDMNEETAYAFEYEPGTVMDGAASEHIKEAAGVLSRYCDAVGIRASELVTTEQESKDVRPWKKLKKDRLFAGFMKHASVPVINMESNLYHPCQGLGDAMTLQECFDDPSSRNYVLTWTYHPKALPVATPHSQAMSASHLGMNVTLAYPDGWDLDSDVMEQIQERAEQTGGTISITHDMDEAMSGANVVCAKSWGALEHYGNWSTELKQRENHRDWIVNTERMKKTDSAYFMHCLPVRRNVVVSDEVLDHERSIIHDQAENRKWAQMALLNKLINGDHDRG